MRLLLLQHRRWPCPSPSFNYDPLLTPEWCQVQFHFLISICGGFPSDWPSSSGSCLLSAQACDLLSCTYSSCAEGAFLPGHTWPSRLCSHPPTYEAFHEPTPNCTGSSFLSPPRILPTFPCLSVIPSCSFTDQLPCCGLWQKDRPE